MALVDPFTVAMSVKDCLCTKLSSTLAGDVCRCMVYPSTQLTADICSKSLAGNGEAKVTISRIYDSRNFPNPDVLLKCDSYTVVEVVQTVRRCAPTLGDTGVLPSIDALNQASMIILDDAHAMRCAIKCCVGSTLISVGEWIELPMQGGCMGGQLTSLVGIDAESCS